MLPLQNGVNSRADAQNVHVISYFNHQLSYKTLLLVRKMDVRLAHGENCRYDATQS